MSGDLVKDKNDIEAVLTSSDNTRVIRAAKNSYGQLRIGTAFNPAQDKRIDTVKALAALLMQNIENLKYNTHPDNNEAYRCFATAQTELETASMFAVRGITHTFGDSDND